MDFLAEIEPGTAAEWFSDELATAASDEAAGSSGQVAMVERTAPEGFMPPLVSRGEAETYRVLDGQVIFFVGNDMVWAEPGDVVVAPAGAARTFRVGSTGARWLVLTRVRSLDRFLDFGRAVSLPVGAPGAGWPSQDEQAAVASIGAVNGIELLGPPGALPDGC
jgi:mannose-6-phosphate isomerase-like protein (cupin superfamily)